MTHNFLQAYVDAAADPFDDWTSVIQNWTILAKASRDAGLIGILFDNEEYFGKIWEYPAQAKYKNLSLEAYAAQWRLRGRETMAAMAAVWPTVRIIHLHGPYASEPRSPREVTRQSGADRHDMRGHFFVGMVEGAPATARVIDGGETYALRSPEEFARHYQWRKHGIAELEPSSLIPPELRPSWPAKVDVAFGVYDRPYDGASMSPAILTRTLRNALARTDEYVWLFVEGQGPNNFLRSDGIEPWWIEAVRDAR